MSRIVLTTIGSLGDLHPQIALALELRKRGHDVVFATHKEYCAKIEALGFEFHRMRPDNTALDDPQEMARIMDLQKGTEYVKALRANSQFAIRNYGQWGQGSATQPLTADLSVQRGLVPTNCELRIANCELFWSNPRDALQP